MGASSVVVSFLNQFLHRIVLATRLAKAILVVCAAFLIGERERTDLREGRCGLAFPAGAAVCVDRRKYRTPSGSATRPQTKKITTFVSPQALLSGG